MLLRQPYDSKTLQSFDKKEETFLVNRYIIQDYAYLQQNKNLTLPDFVKGSSKLKQVVLYGSSDNEKTIRDLIFPLVNEKENWICFDMRRYYTTGRFAEDIQLKKSPDLEFVQVRNVLVGLWSVGHHDAFIDFELPHHVFARWISNLFVHNFDLLGNDKLVIEALAYIFYLRLFSDPRDRSANLELNILRARFKTSSFNTDILDEVYDTTTDMETLADFCEYAFTITNNVRLSGLNTSVLFTTVQNSWMGNSSKQLVFVGLEYPPIFIAMVYYGLKNIVMKNTKIGNAAESLSKRGAGDGFIRAIDNFIAAKYGEI